MSALSVFRAWTARHWTVAAVSAIATAAVMAIPTAVLPNPWFWREVPTPGWAYPVLGLVAILSGLVAATYVRTPEGPGGRRASAAALLGFFAVGCPVCNKLVLLVLGYTGAMSWFEPVQPYLAVLALAGLTAALRARLRGSLTCSVAAAPGFEDPPRPPDAVEPRHMKEVS